MLYLDEKYAKLLSYKLKMFSWNKGLANFRCPLCDDSQKSKIKKRGYFYTDKKTDSLMFKCHNCGVCKPFFSFLKDQDYNLYREYVCEKLNTGGKRYVENEIKVVPKQSRKLIESVPLQSILELDNDHPAKVYIRDRKIPLQHWNSIYYTDNFKKWIHSSFDPDKFAKSDFSKPDKRIVLPFRNDSGKIVGYSGRSIDSECKVRYFTIKLPEYSGDLIYGLDKINHSSKKLYIVEGQFDSLFLPNCIAVAGASLKKLLKIKSDKFVYIFDNEPRNPEIVKQIGQIVDSGVNIVIWPESVQQKDINDMILSGMSKNDLLTVIDNNTVRGLNAKLKFNRWKKV